MNKIYPYAGFWKRVAAFLIDSILVQAVSRPLVGLFMAPALPANTQTMTPQQVLSSLGAFSSAMLVGVVLTCLYFVCMESSKYQATLGKMALGIKVINAQGGRISFLHALGRYAAKIFLSGTFTLNIGYFMAGATRKKQALHDKVANTYVVDKKFQPGDALPEVEPHFGWLWTAIIAELLMLLLLIGGAVALVGLGMKYAMEQANQQRPALQMQDETNRPRPVMPLLPDEPTSTEEQPAEGK